MPAVLDASALLAYLLDEPGAEVVEEALADDAHLSTVNLSEVLARLIRNDETIVSRIAEGWRPAGPYTVAPFLDADAARAAWLWPTTKPFGLSLGDRACLAVAHRLDVPVLTSDQAWGRIDRDAIGVDVHLIR